MEQASGFQIHKILEQDIGMTDRLNWKAIEHGFSKRDQLMADNLAAYTRLQVTVPNGEKDKLKFKDANTYKLTWEELSKYYLENEDKVLPHMCELGHDHCAVEPRGTCVAVAGLMMHIMCVETAVLSALHDEKLQALLGFSQINKFFNRMKKFEPNFMSDLNQALIEVGYTQDLVYQYETGSADFIDTWVRLKGPCPAVRAKPEDYPEPPCPFS